MEAILGTIIKWFIEHLIFGQILKPLFSNINTAAVDGTVYGAMYVENIFPAVRSVGFGVLVLVASWQALKSIFAFTGVEADEPAKIMFRTLIMGFCLGYSKEILMFGTNAATEISSILLKSVGYADVGWGNASSWGREIFLSVTGLDIINSLLLIIVSVKMIGILLRLVERTVLNAFLIIGAPLAFAAGVAQPTKGFLQGFIKVYTGNLILMILQNLGVTILIQFIIDIDGMGSSFISYFIAFAIAAE